MGGVPGGRERDQFKQAPVPCTWFCLAANVSFDALLIKHVPEQGDVGTARGIIIFLSAEPASLPPPPMFGPHGDGIQL